MNRPRKIIGLICIIALFVFSFKFSIVHAEGNTRQFLDTTLIGIEVTVDANASVKPNQNLTMIATLKATGVVHIDRVDLEVFGFLNGTERISIGAFTDSSFDLNNTSRTYIRNFPVPDSIWGVTFGEITLTYSVNISQLALHFPNVVTGFTLTPVENLLIENLQQQVSNLNESLDHLSKSYGDLNQSFTDLNATYWDLSQNYTSAQNSLGELDNTRRLSVILAITTVCFLATTLYIILRRPREY